MRASTNFQPIRKLLVHNPVKNRDLNGMSSKDASVHNFIKIPNPAVIHEQYRNFISILIDQGIELYDLKINRDGNNYHLPNLMFTRDTSITLPWMAGKYIPTKMKLNTRRLENSLVDNFYITLGIKAISVFNASDIIEGGDVLDAVINNDRYVFIGIGKRTNIRSARYFSKFLINKDLADYVILLEHEVDVLHLDTGFCILPGGVCLIAKNTFKKTWRIDKNNNEQSIILTSYLKKLGLNIIEISKDDSITNEVCNILVLNEKTCLTFEMEPVLKSKLTRLTGANFIEVEGSELANGCGGVHCLTRPIY